MRCSHLLISLLCLAVAGCGGSNFSDLRQYVDEASKKPSGSIEPLPKFQTHESFVYSVTAQRSPFQPPIKIELIEQRQGSLDVKPDESRERQFLESFDIDSFQMVGSLSDKRGVFALLNAAGGIHRIKVGDYLGRNHGQVVTITESGIDVMEIVSDGMGGWLERPRTILLKERS